MVIVSMLYAHWLYCQAVIEASELEPSARRTGRVSSDDITTPDWLSTTQVARLLEVNDARVIQMHKQGILKDVEVTPLGRLFNRVEVEALRVTRRAARS